MTYETLPPLEGAGMGINYGFDKLRFIAPVKSGARIRARFFLADVNARPSGWVQVTYDVTIDIEHSHQARDDRALADAAMIERREAPA